MVDNSLVPVRVGDCRCPDSPHPDGDFVYLFPKLGLHGGFVAERTILNLAGGDRPKQAEIEAELVDVYVKYGVADWTFVNEKGPIPVTPETLASELTSDYTLARLVADKADDLYTPVVLNPLVSRLLASLPATPTVESTSPKNGSPVTPRKPSKRSSTTTSGKVRAIA
jgi:hypothetical protein